MKAAQGPRLPPSFAIAVGIFAASTSSILIRFAQIEASSLIIATYRLCFATIFLIPFMLRQPSGAWPDSGRVWWLGILSGFFLAVHFASWISSLEYTSVASSVVFVQTAPLFVAVFSPLFLNEVPSQRAWIGLFIAFSGGVVIAFGDTCTFQARITCPPVSEILGGSALIGDALALIGGLAGAAYLIIGREVRSSLELVPYVSVVYGSAALMLLTWSIVTGEKMFGYSWITYGLFLLLALFPQLLAHTTYNWALKYLPATSVSLSLLGEPLSAALLAWLLLNEAIPMLRILGGAIVLMGIFITVYRNTKRTTRTELRE